MLPKNHISYNQIRQYQICPRKYKLYYIDKKLCPINDKIYLGIVYHSTLEHFFRRKMEGQFLEKSEVFDFFRDLFLHHQEETEIRWPSEASRNHTQNRGIAFVNYFYHEYAKRIQPFLIEEEMETSLEGFDVTLKGIPDLIEKDYSITDFKTTTARWSRTRINQSLLQMVIYKYLFEKHYGDINRHLKFRIIYSRNTSNIKHQELVLDSREIQYDKMFDIIRYVVDQITEGRFPPRPSYFCRMCEYQSTCHL